MDASLLKLVPQENKDEIGTEPFPEEEVFPCLWILESGPRKGQQCNKKAFEGKDFCNAHEVASIRKEIKEEKKSTQKGIVTGSIELPSANTVPMLNVPKTLPPVRPQTYSPPPQVPLPNGQPIYIPQQQGMSTSDMVALLQFMNKDKQVVAPVEPSIPVEVFENVLNLFARTCVAMAEALKNRD
jgi:hypothetical protein